MTERFFCQGVSYAVKRRPHGGAMIFLAVVPTKDREPEERELKVLRSDLVQPYYERFIARREARRRQAAARR